MAAPKSLLGQAARIILLEEAKNKFWHEPTAQNASRMLDLVLDCWKDKIIPGEEWVHLVACIPHREAEELVITRNRMLLPRHNTNEFLSSLKKAASLKRLLDN